VVEEVAQRYLTSQRKRIDVRGPVFTTITAEFEGFPSGGG